MKPGSKWKMELSSSFLPLFFTRLYPLHVFGSKIRGKQHLNQFQFGCMVMSKRKNAISHSMRTKVDSE